MKVSIIGSGIIGLFSAYYLLQEGYEVEIFEQSDRGDGCSFGNAGMIVPSHFIPLAAPGMFEKGFEWMMDAESPFYVKPRLDLSLLRWGWEFKKAATKKRVDKAMPVLRDFALLSKKLYKEFSSHEKAGFGLEEKGLLLLCKDEELLREEIHVAETAKKMGLEARVVDKAGIAQLERQVDIDASGGVYYPGDMHCTPQVLMPFLIEILRERGVKINYNSKLTGINKNKNRIQSISIQTDQGVREYETEKLLLAAGSWSEQLARLFDVRIPMQAGKGYSFVQSNAGVHIPSILVDGRVAVTPFENGNIRFGGTMEIAGINREVNMKRVNGILKTVRSFYPQMDVKAPSEDQVWHGLRPCSPDGLPYIGKLKSAENLYIASGHAMMGLSLAPATGKLLAEMMAGRNPELDCTLFEPLRFD